MLEQTHERVAANHHVSDVTIHQGAGLWIEFQAVAKACHAYPYAADAARARSRSAFLSVLFTVVFGNASRISMAAGTLYFARLARQCARRSSAVIRELGHSTT